ncbi:MAG: sugar ABC transporter ATP-binding protein [Phycisphaerales bacterium]
MQDPTPDSPILSVERVTKDFPAVRALDDVTLSFRRGEVHGIIGENGAGKSTLMKILSGLTAPSAGAMRIRGELVELRGPREALDRGVAMIHQELNLIDELSVADNIFLGRERSRRGFVDHRRTNAEAQVWLERLRSRLAPSRKVATLSIADQQLVEIAKAVSCEASVLIMDEPTAVLTERETQALFELVDSLRREGVTIIYISHILSEVRRLCDRITVMRDGRVVKTVTPDAADEAELARLMVGRPLEDVYPERRPAPGGPPALDVQEVAVPGHVESVSLEVRPGEIVGLAGLVGAGRTETAEAIAGLRRRSRGRITIRGKEASIRSPRDAASRGIAYLSEDRKGRGLILDLSVVENTTLVTLRRYCRILVDRRKERERTELHTANLGVRAGDLRAPVRTLSGGNQQKVAIAKWLDAEPDILILDEPTRGVDVGAKREIYQLIARLADDGRAIIVISSELPELLGLCHRIIVMRDGHIAGELSAEEATEERVMRYAAGVDKAGARSA